MYSLFRSHLPRRLSLRQNNLLQHMTGLEQQQKPFPIILYRYPTHLYTAQMYNFRHLIDIPEYLLTKNIAHKLKPSQL